MTPSRASGHCQGSTKDWVGNAVAAVLKLDVTNKMQKAKISRLLKAWFATGMVVIVTDKDSKGNERPFVEVGEWATDD